MPDFEKARIRSRIEAWMLDSVCARADTANAERKAAVLGAMHGTVVEIGPGTGVNMPYYGSDVHVIGIEPNPAMHERLHDKAERHGVDLEIRTLRGEHLDVADQGADAVVGTLVLCSVDDPGAVAAEVVRVLRPGGTYFFLEHVGAPPGTLTRRVQHLVLRPHRWMFNGCEVDRDTAATLRDAGFSTLEIDELDAGPMGGYVRHLIAGTAVK